MLTVAVKIDPSKFEVKSQDRSLISLIPCLGDEIKGNVELGYFESIVLEQNQI